MSQGAAKSDQPAVRLTAAITAFDLDGPALVARALNTTADHPIEKTAAFYRNSPPQSLNALGCALRSLDLISDAVWTEVLARATDLPAIDRKVLHASHALPADDPRRPQPCHLFLVFPGFWHWMGRGR